MENSKIAWTDNTFNPWIGCTRISDGCLHCYAESQDHRWGHDRWGKGKTRTLTSKAIWDKVLTWNKEARETGIQKKVFCASMADIFDQEVPDEWRHKLFNHINLAPYITWLLLTKRATEQRIWLDENYTGDPPHIWPGVTIESQKNIGRIYELERMKGAVRWISYEPSLGPLDIPKDVNNLGWVICGGESGNGARPFNLKWARNLRDQCQERGISFFMKQLGCNWNGDTLEERDMNWKNKWDRPEDWPADLNVRQFPVGI